MIIYVGKTTQLKYSIQKKYLLWSQWLLDEIANTNYFFCFIIFVNVCVLDRTNCRALSIILQYIVHVYIANN